MTNKSYTYMIKLLGEVIICITILGTSCKAFLDGLTLFNNIFRWVGFNVQFGFIHF